MTRRPFPARVMVAAYERSMGSCEKCGGLLVTGRINYDHVIPDAMGGEPTVDNCAVLCKACHDDKTHRRDVPAIAKVKRIRAKHIGARKPSSFPKAPEGYNPWTRRIER